MWFFETILLLLAIGLFACAFALFAKVERWRTRSMLDRWAKENGYRIVSSKVRRFALHPFFLTTSSAQSILRIHAVDRRGQLRSGWARCGHFVAGLLTDDVSIRWDEPPPSTEPPAVADLPPTWDRQLDG